MCEAAESCMTEEPESKEAARAPAIANDRYKELTPAGAYQIGASVTLPASTKFIYLLGRCNVCGFKLRYAGEQQHQRTPDPVPEARMFLHLESKARIVHPVSTRRWREFQIPRCHVRNRNRLPCSHRRT